jgi:hypothetical protein
MAQLHRAGTRGVVAQLRREAKQLKESAGVEGLRLVALARSTGADERPDELHVVVDEEIGVESLQGLLYAIMSSRVGEL